MPVKLYALSTCPYCRMTKKFLQEGGVEFELIEVDLLDGDTKDPATPKGGAVEEVRRISGGASFPVVVIGEEVIVGFNKKRIKELLGL
jgi:glutaredoxin